MIRNNKDPQSMIEVWNWKEKVYEKLKNKADKIAYLQKDTEEVIIRLGLKSIISKKVIEDPCI